MKHLSIMPLQSKLYLFLTLLLLSSSHPALANPISNPSLRTFHDAQSPQSHADVPLTRSRPDDVSMTFPQSAELRKRVTVSHYRNLGPFRMVLTASTAFYSAGKDAAHLISSTPPPTDKIVPFLSDVAAQARKALTSKEAESAIVEFGAGALELAFRVRDGVGAPTVVPWDLVMTLAEYFEMRARYGNPMGFRAVVTGPLGMNVLGGSPWIEVVLVVAGQGVMDGFPWSVY